MQLVFDVVESQQRVAATLTGVVVEARTIIVGVVWRWSRSKGRDWGANNRPEAEKGTRWMPWHVKAMKDA